MAKLTAKERKALPSSAFAGPNRSFPVNDPSHARNAKARASQAVNSGRMSPSMEKKIDRKADKKLTMRPEAMPRGKHGRGHDMPGLGTSGEHRNVVNAHSHADKMKHC